MSAQAEVTEPLPFAYAGSAPVLVALSAGEVRLMLHALHKLCLDNMKARTAGILTAAELNLRNDAIDELAMKVASHG